MVEDLMLDEATAEVEISYSQEALIEKLKNHGLNPKSIIAKLGLNATQLDQVRLAHHIQTDTFAYQLFDSLKRWPINQSINSFTTNTNQLIFLWLNALQEGSSNQTIMELVKCLEAKSFLWSTSTSKFHLFLYELVAETSHRHQQLALDYLLNFDTNTQLPNINQIISSLDAVASQATPHQKIGLLSIHFQPTRNKLSFSKLVALDLNKQIANILQRNIAADFQLYFSGDSQFDILIPNLNGVAQLNLVVAKISRAFEEMLLVHGQSILVTPFVGCAFTVANTQNAHDIYNDSKLALESAIAKQLPFILYSDDLKQQLLEQNNLEAKVLEAFGSDNLVLFFQPIVNLKNSKCVGAELLLRWSEKFGYNVYPSLTIEILNKVGKGKLFTRWLINSACRYASELISEHKLKIYLTINLRAEDLYDTELPHLLSQAIALWKLNPKDIILEITENGILEYNENSNSVITQLSENGFRFALDDFGTGFSSLSRLRTMPIDLIKIDQSFVKDISHSKDDFEIVQSIALLAKSLGKEVLVEGVEDEACLSLIKTLEIDKCQGYYYAKPMPFEQFIEWAKAH